MGKYNGTKGMLFHSQIVLKLINTEVSLVKMEFCCKTTNSVMKIQDNLTEQGESTLLYLYYYFFSLKKR